MNVHSLILVALVSSCTFVLGLLAGNIQQCGGEFWRTGTAAQVQYMNKQDKEKTIVDLINENP